jgi:ABC-type Na+ efflux pump permease subunit
MFGAGVWPVVQRELRAAARWPLGRWLRVGGALGGIVALWISADVPFDQMGVELFQRLHTLLLWLICAIVPALTADCLARERREGTLGLLFMTSLSASGIVLGKTLVQMLRALTVWLAVVPVLTIPFLCGGVTWSDVISLLVIELCVGFLCLAAGILASSLTDQRAIAFVVAFLLMAAFVEGADHYQNWMMLNNARTTTYRRAGNWIGPSPVFVGSGVMRSGFRLQATRGGAMFASMPGGISSALMWRPPALFLAENFTIALIVLLAALRFAGWCVERSWQDKIPSVRQQGWARRYCTPVFKLWFVRGMRRTLEWNPIAWLQQYSWKARLSKWGLCLLFVLLECAVIDGNNPYALASLLMALLLVLGAAYTYAGVNGFLQEKKSGALELILVSPLSVPQIIFGRVWGLWKQFLPSVVLLVASDIAVHLMIPQYHFHYGLSDVSDEGWLWVKELEIVAIYLTLPIYATSCALRFKNLFLASALTWLALLLAAGAAFLILLMPPLGVVAACFAIVAGNFFLAGLVLWLLRQNLQRRSYSF